MSRLHLSIGVEESNEDGESIENALSIASWGNLNVGSTVIIQKGGGYSLDGRVGFIERILKIEQSHGDPHILLEVGIHLSSTNATRQSSSRKRTLLLKYNEVRKK